jgi:hypothetical protein
MMGAVMSWFIMGSRGKYFVDESMLKPKLDANMKERKSERVAVSTFNRRK